MGRIESESVVGMNGTNGFKPAGVHAELPTEKLRWRCDTSRLPFETTAQAELREGFIGQERALRALKMGVEMSAPGYNIFVCGLAGARRGGKRIRSKKRCRRGSISCGGGFRRFLRANRFRGRRGESSSGLRCVKRS